MNDEKEKSYKDRNVWLRGVFMLLFIFLMGIAKFVTLVVVAMQFLHLLLTGKMNKNLLQFGNSLSVYHYHIMLYLTYNSDVQPFPMSSWPENHSPESDTQGKSESIE